MQPHLIRQLLIALTLALPGQYALGEAAQDPRGERLVNDFLNGVATMQGRFEQSLIDADGTIVEVSSGTLEIDRPSRFRWVYDEPYEQWLVADGTNVWSYDVDLAQVTVKPQAEALKNTPAMLLGDAEKALLQFRFDGSFVAGDITSVRLQPLDTSNGFDRVELGFIDGELRRMVFFDNLEQTTLVTFRDIKINAAIDDDSFVFTVPDDADLVGVPLAAGNAGP